jgi:hypothetical protein
MSMVGDAVRPFLGEGAESESGIYILNNFPKHQ